MHLLDNNNKKNMSATSPDERGPFLAMAWLRYRIAGARSAGEFPGKHRKNASSLNAKK